MAITLASQTKSKKAAPAKRGANPKAARIQPRANPGLGFWATSWPSWVTPQLKIAPIIQAKLKIGQPNDKYEQEADRVADEVMRMPDDSTPVASHAAIERGKNLFPENRKTSPPLIQRFCSACEEQLQKQPIEGEEKLLQTKTAAIDSAPTASPPHKSHTQTIQGGGQPLPKSVRTYFEPRFGYDFSQVRIHTNARSSESAHSLNAKAYTVGQDIVFGTGQYAPSASEGRRLLAHELTHTIQQSTVHPLANKGVLQRTCNPDPDAELEEGVIVGQVLGVTEGAGEDIPLSRRLVSLNYLISTHGLFSQWCSSENPNTTIVNSITNRYGMFALRFNLNPTTHVDFMEGGRFSLTVFHDDLGRAPQARYNFPFRIDPDMEAITESVMSRRDIDSLQLPLTTHYEVGAAVRIYHR